VMVNAYEIDHFLNSISSEACLIDSSSLQVRDGLNSIVEVNDSNRRAFQNIVFLSSSIN
jgi:hypothetical protein